jgi:molybdopterin-dependent oxidoreductase alpha subunit
VPNPLPGPATVTSPPESAAGLPAMLSITRTALDQMGIPRSIAALYRMNQHDGFDCPGCAWPDPGTPGRFEFCENGVKAVASEATRRRASPAFFAEHSVDSLRQRSESWLDRAGRITHPMVLRPGDTHYRPIAWEDAFTEIGAALRSLSAPDRAAFYTSGRTSNEAAFLYQLFARRFGTNNLPDCSNMCHESSGVGLIETIGIGKGSVTLEDIHNAKLILVLGQNPGSNHPRMLVALQHARRKGARIVAVNPLREPGLLRFKHPKELNGTLGAGTAIADRYLQIRINGDVAFLKGLCKVLLEIDALHPGAGVDRAFVDARTSGFEALADDLRQTTWDEITASSGLAEAAIREVAGWCAQTDRLICTWAMGLTQHVNAVANIQSVVNLLLMRGAFGKPGAGACPVRGHSNVQGDRTMGIWERPSAALCDQLERAFGFTVPRAHGLDTVHAIEAMHRGEIGVFFALGGNFVAAAPDTAYVAAAMRKVPLTVQVSTKLNRSHLDTGGTAMILPCLGRTELDTRPGGPQFVTVEDSMGVVHRSQGRLPPASPALLSEPEIVARVAEATLGADVPVPWRWLVEDYDRVRDRIAATLPGFEDFNRRVRRPGGFALPHPVRDRLEFRTADGRARFTAHAIPSHDLRDGELLMMTVRTHDQYNTTVYDDDDRYRGLHGGRRVVLLHPDDIAQRALEPGQRVTLVSRHGESLRRAEGWQVVPYQIPRGQCATYFPEANVLVPVTQYAERSHTPASKSVIVRVEA